MGGEKKVRKEAEECSHSSKIFSKYVIANIYIYI